MSKTSDALSPTKRLVDAAGALIQEANHHKLPAGLRKKIVALEKASGRSMNVELQRIEVQDRLLAAQFDKETVIKLLDLHFNAAQPGESRVDIAATPTDFILRWFGEMFAVAIGDAENYVTTELTFVGRGEEITDRYELTIKKLFGLSPQQKYNDLARRSQAVATQVLLLLNRHPDAAYSPHVVEDLKRALTKLAEIDVPPPGPDGL